MEFLGCHMKKIKLLGVMGMLLLVLAGCRGTDADVSGDDGQSSSASVYENWREEGFALEAVSAATEMEGSEEEALHEVLYQEFAVESPDFAYETQRQAVGYYGDTLYTFTAYETQTGIRYFLEKQSAGEDVRQETEIVLPGEIAGGYALSLDVVSEKKQYVLFMETIAAGAVSPNLCVLEINEQGSVESAWKLSEEFLSREETPAVSLFMVDEQGYVFLVNGQHSVMYIYDEEGNQVLQREYEDDFEDRVRGGFRLPDGSVVLLVGNYETASTALVWYDVSTMQPKTVQTLEGGAIAKLCATQDGYIYYINTSRLYAWDLSTGTQTKLFDCVLNSIEYEQIDGLTVTGDGKIALYCTQSGKTSVYVLSDEEKAETGEGIRMVFLDSSDPYLKTTVASFSRKYPDMAISIETASGDEEAYCDRIMAQLVNGKGPDLLWVSAVDMQILYEKGVIEPLTDLIGEETLAQIFPGVLAGASMEDTLYGIYFDAMPTTFVVNKELLGKDTWEIEDLVSIASQNPGLEGLMTSAFSFDEGTLLRILALNDLEKSPYLDLVNYQSYFNSDGFMGLLECLKQFGPLNASTDGLQRVCDGEYLAYRASVEIRDLVAFSEVMGQCEESCLLLGFPGSGQYSGCWMQDSFLVVNASSQYKEEIEKFLEYALSLTAQKECTKGSVRKDIISTQVYVHEYYGTYVYGSGARELVLKENGETYLEDYLAFLENCAPLPRSYETIETIVSEEVDMFFNGNYTATQVAENIDNRVQLYLDEQY